MRHGTNGLNAIPGERIRRQYFNIPIYFVLMFCTPFIVILVAFEISKGIPLSKDSLSAVLALPVMLLLVLIPLGILSALNRFFFGKTICVLNEKGLYFSDGKVRCISWNDIKEVAYEPDLPSTKRSIRNLSCNAIHITTKPFKKKITTTIFEAPFYLLGRIKKYHPNAKYRVKKFCIMLALSMTLIPIILSVCSLLFE